MTLAGWLRGLVVEGRLITGVAHHSKLAHGATRFTLHGSHYKDCDQFPHVQTVLVHQVRGVRALTKEVYHTGL